MLDFNIRVGYIGPQCDVLFISAVYSCASEGSFRPFFKKPSRPLGFTSPPATPESRSSIPEPSHSTYLPPRQDWARHIDRYFRDINSTYWLISAENFCSRLDSTYAAQNSEEFAAPWTCFLYATLALTSQSQYLNSQSTKQFGISTPISRPGGDLLTPADYISRARSLLKDIMDEANLDSVRALCAMVRKPLVEVSILRL